MHPTNRQNRGFRKRMLFVMTFLVVVTAFAFASGWVALAADGVSEFLDRAEFRALAAVLSTTAQPVAKDVVAEPIEPANLASASLCLWETFGR